MLFTQLNAMEVGSARCQQLHISKTSSPTCFTSTDLRGSLPVLDVIR